MSRRTSTQCACKHVDEFGNPIPGSGSIDDPYVHEAPRIVCFRSSGASFDLPISRFGCVRLPNYLKGLFYASDNTRIQPDEDGHLVLRDLLTSFRIIGTNHSDINFDDRVAEFNFDNNTVLFTQTGAAGSSVLPRDGSLVESGRVYQNVVYTPGGTTEELSFPQIRTEDQYTDQILYPFSNLATNGFDVRVPLWTGGLAIDRATTVITHVRFSMTLNETFPNTNFTFQILGSNSSVRYQGDWWAQSFEYWKNYSYFFPIEFTGPNTLINNGNVEFRVNAFNGIDPSSTLTLRDILVTHTFM